MTVITRQRVWGVGMNADAYAPFLSLPDTFSLYWLIFR
jgi:hypothetical protein